MLEVTSCRLFVCVFPCSRAAAVQFCSVLSYFCVSRILLPTVTLMLLTGFTNPGFLKAQWGGIVWVLLGFWFIMDFWTSIARFCQRSIEQEND